MMVCGQYHNEIKSEVAFHTKTLVNERNRIECLMGLILVLSKSVFICRDQYAVHNMTGKEPQNFCFFSINNDSRNVNVFLGL